MLKKLHLVFSVFIIFSLNISFSKADLLSPNSSISPSQVVKIQLVGLMNNDDLFKDSGIEQTWNFAHPNNKKNTGPLPNFKMMIKGNSYQMLLDHISHTITELGRSDKWAQFEVVILDKEKIYHKFNWQVEKLTIEGPLMNCWLTTMVSNPIPLGSSI
jgi:ABC-type sugar transport system permease subunit